MKHLFLSIMAATAIILTTIAARSIPKIIKPATTDSVAVTVQFFESAAPTATFTFVGLEEQGTHVFTAGEGLQQTKNLPDGIYQIFLNAPIPECAVHIDNGETQINYTWENGQIESLHECYSMQIICRLQFQIQLKNYVGHAQLVPAMIIYRAGEYLSHIKKTKNGKK